MASTLDGVTRSQARAIFPSREARVSRKKVCWNETYRGDAEAIWSSAWVRRARLSEIQTARAIKRSATACARSGRGDNPIASRSIPNRWLVISSTGARAIRSLLIGPTYWSYSPTACWTPLTPIGSQTAIKTSAMSFESSSMDIWRPREL
jgi:hypothetical protein